MGPLRISPYGKSRYCIRSQSACTWLAHPIRRCVRSQLHVVNLVEVEKHAGSLGKAFLLPQWSNNTSQQLQHLESSPIVQAMDGMTPWQPYSGVAPKTAALAIILVLPSTKRKHRKQLSSPENSWCRCSPRAAFHHTKAHKKISMLDTPVLSCVLARC